MEIRPSSRSLARSLATPLNTVANPPARSQRSLSFARERNRMGAPLAACAVEGLSLSPPPPPTDYLVPDGTGL